MKGIEFSLILLTWAATLLMFVNIQRSLRARHGKEAGQTNDDIQYIKEVVDSICGEVSEACKDSFWNAYRIAKQDGTIKSLESRLALLECRVHVDPDAALSRGIEPAPEPEPEPEPTQQNEQE
jgi:hypothetical protein